MHIRSVDDVTGPLNAPWGETVYELIGASPASGDTRSHSLAQIVLPPGKSSNRHYHRLSEESYYILAGEAALEVDGQETRLAPGQAVLIRPPSAHRIRNAGEEALIFLAVCVPAWVPGDSYDPAD
jgi:mannose-6-phosphate isomerase-like protein (cupin superfamily)